jgi:tRNA(Ile)-lysidine synthase
MADSRKPAGARHDPLHASVRAALVRARLQNRRVAVALSGGIDSVVLLDVLHALAPGMGVALSAMHVNHRISPNAHRWETFCRALCSRLRVPLTVRRVALGARRGKGIEAAAREARYAALARAPTDCVALAHQCDDQAETVLLNLLRGAGARGAAAMPETGALPGNRAATVIAVRPLLGVSRADVAAYAKRRGLVWIEDETNADERLARNFLRHRIGPLLDERWPRWREALARAAGHFGRVDAGERTLLREFLAARGMRAPSEAKLVEMLRQLSSPRVDSRAAIAHDGAVLRRWRGAVQVEESKPAAGFESLAWRGERALRLAALGGELRFHRCSGAGIDAARIAALGLEVRLRGGGERFRVAAGRPRRTLKNLFQEAGIAPWERERLPMVYCGEALVWVPGLGVSADWQASARRKGVLPEWIRA